MTAVYSLRDRVIDLTNDSSEYPARFEVIFTNAINGHYTVYRFAWRKIAERTAGRVDLYPYNNTRVEVREIKTAS